MSPQPEEAVSEVSRARIATLYPGLRPLVYRVCEDIFLMTRRRIGVAQGRRTMGSQLELYQRGRKLINGQWVITDPKQIVTNAKPGLSFHCYGLAWDAAWRGPDPYLEKEPKDMREQLWKLFGDMGKAHGFAWGGDFRLANGAKDLPHLEMTFGLSITDCVELYERGGLRAVWAHLDQIRGVPEGQDWGLPVEGGE